MKIFNGLLSSFESSYISSCYYKIYIFKVVDFRVRISFRIHRLFI